MSPADLNTWRCYVDEVAAAKFEGLEFLPPYAPAVSVDLLRLELQQRRLALAGLGLYDALDTPAGRGSLEAQLDIVSIFVAELDADYLFVIDEMYADVMSGELTRPAVLDDVGWSLMVEGMHDLNEQAHGLCGLPLLLHPHQYTHIDTPGQIERFLADTDPSRVSLLLDVGHYTFRGGDPVALYARHHERIGHLHLKNVQHTLLPAEVVPQRTLVGTGAFADLTVGDVDFRGLREALEVHEYAGWLTVEIERLAAMPGRPVDLAQTAVQYLREIGY